MGCGVRGLRIYIYIYMSVYISLIGLICGSLGFGVGGLRFSVGGLRFSEV